MAETKLVIIEKATNGWIYNFDAENTAVTTVYPGLKECLDNLFKDTEKLDLRYFEINIVENKKQQ